MIARSSTLANPTELRLLVILAASKNLTGIDVLNAFREALPRETLTKGSMHTALSRMADKGWLSAGKRKGADGRYRLFVIKPKGRKVLASSKAFYAALAAFKPTPKTTEA